MKHSRAQIDELQELASICPGDFFIKLEGKKDELNKIAHKLEQIQEHETTILD